MDQKQTQPTDQALTDLGANMKPRRRSDLDPANPLQSDFLETDSMDSDERYLV